MLLVPRAGGEDRELPATPPVPSAAPTTVEAAFGVFRRPATAAERDVRFVVPKLPEIRRIANTPRADVYLAAARDRLCFAVLPAGRENGGVASCGAPQGYFDGHKIKVGTFFPRGRASTFAAAFPDGVQAVTVTLQSGERLTFPVTTNGAAGELSSSLVALEWVAPDGQAQRIDYRSAKPLQASDIYSALRRPARAGEELVAAGARELLRANSVRAWLAPQGSGLCLIVRVKAREARRCRARIGATDPPLIVAVRGGGGGRVAVAAFQDRITGFNLAPEAGIDRATKTYGAMIWADGGERRTLRYETPEGTHRVAIPG